MNSSSEVLELSKKSNDYYAKLRHEMLGFISHDARKILDIGCGKGLFGRQLKEKFDAEVWGIEIDPESAADAQNGIDKIWVGDVTQLIEKLPDDYFDCIVFNDVLEHIVNPFKVLLEIKIKLKKEKGVVVCSIPNVRYILNLRELLVKKQWKYKDDGILDKTHLRFFTQKSIVDMFETLGYEILKIEGINAITSYKFKLLNLIFLGSLSDTRYLQFACVVKPVGKCQW